MYMQKWEYQTQNMPTQMITNNPEWDQIRKILAQMGEKGWELVQILPGNFKMIFKRKIHTTRTAEMLKELYGE